MIPALSQVCSLPSDFAENVAEYAKGGCQTIELWLTKLEQYLQDHSVADARQLLDRHGVTAPVASYQGGLFQLPSAGFDESWQAFHNRLAVCRDLGVRTIVVAGDVRGQLDQQLVDLVIERLEQIAAAAEEQAVEVAFEFQAAAAFPNNLQTAVSLVSSVSRSALGICFDVFHFYTGPSKWTDLGLLDAGNLFHVQLCDLADVSRELATDSQRILPGDEGGCIAAPPIGERLHQIGYQRLVSVELMNPHLWQVPPRPFTETALAALRSVMTKNPIN